MIENQESKTRDIPIWLTTLVLILTIGGGGWLIVWYSQRSDPTRLVDLNEEDKVILNHNKGGKNAGGGAPNNAMFRGRDLKADGIQDYGRNSFRVKVGKTQMLVNYANANRFDVNPQYVELRTPEQAELTMMRMSAMVDATWREYLKLTDEQLEKLRNVPTPPAMQIDPADRARLSELWKAYHDGPADQKPTAEKNLLAALDEVGKKHIAATQQLEAARAEAIKAVFTPEQIKMYKDSGGNRPPSKTIKG